MITLVSLNVHDQAKIDAKLAELRQKTGCFWTCEITKTPESRDGRCLLEIAIDRKILKPVILDCCEAKSADRICRELDLAHDQES